MVHSTYLIEVNNEHVILGNSALLKCTIPSFVTDFVAVATWTVTGPQSDDTVDLDYHSSGTPTYPPTSSSSMTLSVTLSVRGTLSDLGDSEKFE